MQRGYGWGVEGGTTHVAGSVACIRIRTRLLRGGTMNQPSIKRERQGVSVGLQHISVCVCVCIYLCMFVCVCVLYTLSHAHVMKV
jgi:hypothetical protein